jgi:hypothetical protein
LPPDASGHPQYKPAGRHERLALLDASVDAIQRLPYLKIVATSEADNEEEMIRLQCKADGRVAAELMQSAIRAVWKSHVVRGKTSLHIIRVTERGFDFRFTLLEHGVFSTGIYAVELGAASPEAVIETSNC